MLGFAVAGFRILAVQVSMYAVVAHVHPTSCRAGGVGLAVGMGTLVGVLSVFAGAAILAGAGASGFFIAVTMVLAVTVLDILLLKRHIPGAGPAAP